MKPFTRQDLDKLEELIERRGEKKREHVAMMEYSEEEQHFYEGLKCKTRKKIDAIEAQIIAINQDTVPMRFKILQSAMTIQLKALAIQKLASLEELGESSGEYSKVKQWVNAVTQLPMGVYKPLLIESPQHFLTNTKHLLDKEVYGHEDAKKQILLTLAKWAVNPDGPGCVIGIEGPPGCGKSLLVTDGISKALDLPFAFVPLGGANDTSFLDGHSYTYEGSTWGKIISVLMKAKCMNPVICFDELDKVADNHRGNEIYNVLIHMTDSTQNDRFNDKYFTDIDFDLSRCIMIFTYNDETKVHSILRDRMIRVRVKNYEVNDKFKILKDYVLPKLLPQYGFSHGDIAFPDGVLARVITLSGDEPGMRDIKRNMDSVVANINIMRLMNDPSVVLPFTCTEAFALKFLHKHEKHNFASVAHIYT